MSSALRDGEKLDRMVATLVTALPAEHEGGELIVSHDGGQHEIVFIGTLVGSAGQGAVGRDLVKVMPHSHGYVCPQVARHFCPVGIRREKIAPVKTL